MKIILAFNSLKLSALQGTHFIYKKFILGYLGILFMKRKREFRRGECLSGCASGLFSQNSYYVSILVGKKYKIKFWGKGYTYLVYIFKMLYIDVLYIWLY